MSDLTNNPEFAKFIEKINYFSLKEKELTNVILSTYTIDNVPEILKDRGGETLILKALFFDGCCLFTGRTNIGFVASAPEIKTINVFDDIATTGLKICNFPFNKDNEIIRVMTPTGLLERGEFVPVYCNRSHTGYFTDIQQCSNTYSQIQMLLHNNLFVKSLQLIFEGKESQQNSFEEIEEMIYNQLGIVNINVEAGFRIDDFLKVITNQIEWLGDKCIELTKSNDSEFLARIGINHIPYEKRERLTNDEISTQNQLIDVVREGIINTVNEGLEEVNKTYGYNMRMRLALNKVGDNNDVVTE